MLLSLLDTEKHHGSCHNAYKLLALGHSDLASELVGLASVSCSDGSSVGCSVGEYESFFKS